MKNNVWFETINACYDKLILKVIFKKNIAWLLNGFDLSPHVQTKSWENMNFSKTMQPREYR